MIRWNIPNILTLIRIILVPCVFICSLYLKSPTIHYAGFILYVTACVTDFFDGYLARKFQTLSSFGSMLDPIADKLLVASVLLSLTFTHVIKIYLLPAGLIILLREILVSGLREFLAQLKVSMPVTQLSKWKTTLQMVALGGLLFYTPWHDPSHTIFFHTLFFISGLFFWVAAILTVITGFDYVKAGMRYINH